MSTASLRQPQTEAEAWFYRQGVIDVLTLAKRSAEVIGASSDRHIPKGFAVAALDELARQGMTLITPPAEGSAVAAKPSGVPPTPPIPAEAAVL